MLSPELQGPFIFKEAIQQLCMPLRRQVYYLHLNASDQDYIFFVENDVSLRIDSALMYNTATERFAIYQTYEGGATLMSSRTTDLRNMLMNQIGLRTPTGIPRKEFIETLGGNYIVVNNVTNVVSGSARSTFGYMNAEQVILFRQLDLPGRQRKYI